MVVFVEGPTEAVVSAYVQMGDLGRIGNRFRACVQWWCLAERTMRAMVVAVVLELPEGVEEMMPVPDQRAVE